MCDVCGCGDPELAARARARHEHGEHGHHEHGGREDHEHGEHTDRAGHGHDALHGAHSAANAKTTLALDVEQRILSANERAAAHNREHFREHGVLALNVMGSPGSGKTALLEATAARLPGRRLAALSGDLATEHDAERLARAGIAARAITTGTACHLDAAMVHHALHALDWQGADCLFIENVGNLVCPAIYDLGQRANVVLLSVTEGEDKPQKYPVMFRAADLVVVTKTDLLPHLPGVSLARIRDSLARVVPEPRLITVSAVTGEGMDEWLAWLAKWGAEERARG